MGNEYTYMIIFFKEGREINFNKKNLEGGGNMVKETVMETKFL